MRSSYRLLSRLKCDAWPHSGSNDCTRFSNNRSRWRPCGMPATCKTFARPMTPGTSSATGGSGWQVGAGLVTGNHRLRLPSMTP
jgi:hypothetical protein